MTPSPPISEHSPEASASKSSSLRTLLSGARLWGGSLLVLLALYGGRGLLNERSTHDNAEDANTPSAIDFDAYSNGVTSVLYDIQGNIEYTLEASSQTHYLDNSTQLSDPYVRLYQDTGSRWNIVARSGKILAAQDSDKIDRLDLSDEVELFQIDSQGNRLTLSTSFLSLHPAEKMMHTDQEVTMTTNTLHQTAVGMTANLQQDRLTFLSEVKGRYETQSSQP